MEPALKRYVPILVTAFVGATPASPETTSGKVETTRNRMERNHASRSSFSQRREDVRALVHDAVDHWAELARNGHSERTRWEARRRALVCLAWESGHRSSLARLARLENPHSLTYLEICREYDAHRFGIA